MATRAILALQLVLATIPTSSCARRAAREGGVADGSFPAVAAILQPTTTSCDNAAGDLGIAVSASKIVLTSNCLLQIRSKTGTLVAQRSIRAEGGGAGLFTTDPDDLEANRRIFDPQVIYDGKEDRFWIIAAESLSQVGGFFGAPRLHVAVSTNGDPTNWTSSWHVFTGSDSFDPTLNTPPFPSDSLLDRPSICVNGGFVFVTLNTGKDSTRDDDDTMAYILKKSPMLAGSKPMLSETTTLFMDKDITWGHWLAVDSDIPAAGNLVYLIATTDPHATPLITTVQSQIRLGALRSINGVSWTYSSLLVGTLGATGSYYGVCGTAPGSPDLGGGVRDSNLTGFSLFWNCKTRLVGGTRYIWAAQQVRSTSDGPACESGFVDPSYVQWYKIDPQSWPLTPGALPSVEFSRLDNPASRYFHDPSIAVSAYDVVALNYTEASTSTYPVLTSWLDYPYAEKAVQDYVDDSNWTDFSGMVADPSDPCVFWGHGQQAYNDGNPNTHTRWQSYLIRVSDPGCPVRLGDLDGNGVIDAVDVFEFRRAYEANHAKADIDGNITVDPFDFLALMSLLHGERPPCANTYASILLPD